MTNLQRELHAAVYRAGRARWGLVITGGPGGCDLTALDDEAPPHVRAAVAELRRALRVEPYGSADEPGDGRDDQR